jgi:copper(I)-binding protein
MLKPGGYHVMFMGLKAPLKMGEMIKLTLVFEKAGEIEIMAHVMKAGAMGGMKMKH